MELEFLNKPGLKNLGNILKFLEDPDLIKNPSQKTFFSKKENRENVITQSFKNLKEEDKKLLIEYLVSNEAATMEIIKAFNTIDDMESKSKILEFLVNLMNGTENKEIKLDIFKIIYLNDITCPLNILHTTKDIQWRADLLELSRQLNSERGYILQILNTTDTYIPSNLSIDKLVAEINDVQSVVNYPILEKILSKFEKPQEFIEVMNKELFVKDFKTYYTIALNSNIIKDYNFNVNQEEIDILKWSIELIKSKNNKLGLEVDKRDLDLCSTEWLLFISDNLPNINEKGSRLSVILLNHIVANRELSESQSESIANNISLLINKNETIKYYVFETLKKLKTTKDIYNILEYSNQDPSLLKDSNFQDYIEKKIEYSSEYRWIEEIEKNNNHIDSKELIVPKAIILALRKKSNPRTMYNILKIIKENNKSLYLDIINEISQLIDIKLNDEKKLIKLLIALNHIPEDKNVSKKIKDYESENQMVVKTFLEFIDPSLIEKHFINDIKTLIENNDTASLIDLLEKIDKQEIMQECSNYIFDILIENDIYTLIDIWDYLTLNVQRRLCIKDVIIEMIKNNEFQLIKQNIHFANKIDIDPLLLYKSIQNEDSEKTLLDIWYDSSEIGKITDILKEVIVNEVHCLEDTKNVYRVFKEYNITNNNIFNLIKIKAYTYIGIELLELDLESEDSKKILDYLASQLVYFNIVDRFLVDKFLQNELGNRKVNYLLGNILSAINTNELLKYYWSNIVNDLQENKHDYSQSKVDMFFAHITKSNKSIEYFLEILEDKDFEKSIYLVILEHLLLLSNKQNRLILQANQNMDRMNDEILTSIGSKISSSLSNLESTIINRSKNLSDDVLIENIKALRKSLSMIGVETIEDIENYGKEVDLDKDIHQNTQFEKMNKGMVDSLGIKVNGKNILLSSLLNVD